MRQGFLWTPVLSAVMAVGAQAQNPQLESPQQKIVQKYNLAERLQAAQNDEAESGYEGCRQPNGTTDKAAYNDFRTIAERGRILDALVIVCDQIGIPGAQGAVADFERHIVHVTSGVMALPKKNRKTVFGHEITHVAREEPEQEPLQEIADYNRFESDLAGLAYRRLSAHDLLTVNEIRMYQHQEQNLQARIVDATNNAAQANQASEEMADVGGLILAAGPRCKIDPETSIKTLQVLAATVPASFSQVSLSHPALTQRDDDLRKITPAAVEACRTYYKNTASSLLTLELH